MSRSTISRDQDTADQIDKILLANENEAANFPNPNFKNKRTHRQAVSVSHYE